MDYIMALIGDENHSVSIYLFKGSNGNTRTVYQIYSNLTIKILKRRHMMSFWCLMLTLNWFYRYIVLVFSSLILNK